MNAPSLALLMIALPATAVAVAMKPWRMLRGPLLQPLLALLVLMPLAWASEAMPTLGLALQLSGACLGVLMLGWPLLMLLMPLVALLAAWLAGWGAAQAVQAWMWMGVLPALAALGVGLAVRRWLPAHPFVYVLGRAFFGTMLVLLPCGLLRALALHTGAATLHTGELAVAQWLLSWGEASITGMLAAAMMVYRPQWLATFARPPGWPQPSGT